MMWLAKLSKTVIVILGLVFGLGFILLTNPPHTPCTSQLEQMKSRHNFFVLDNTKRYQKTTEYQKSFIQCQEMNNPGGCFTLFKSVRNLLSDLSAVQSNCFKTISQTAEFNTSMWNTTKLIVESAWGDEPPVKATGWLDRSHLSLFCKLKDHLLKLNEQNNKWEQFREGLLESLPGSENMSRSDIWARTIFAVDCKKIY